MDSIAIEKAWREFFGDCPPIGHCCRHTHAGRWLRIHSLPKSKRYPDTNDEISEMLHRHNSVATSVLGNHAPIVVFVPLWLGSGGRVEGFDLIGTSLKVVGVSNLSTTDEEGNWVGIAAGTAQWRSGEFNDLISDIAMWKSKALFANLQTGSVYAPYDGGADLFLSDTSEVAEAKARWSAWLSTDQSGL